MLRMLPVLPVPVLLTLLMLLRVRWWRRRAGHRPPQS
jgi:hypothetical protein